MQLTIESSALKTGMITSTSVFFPFSFVLRSRYFTFGSISVIKFNSKKSKISMSLIKKKDKHYFLPDLKIIYFNFSRKIYFKNHL